MADLVKYAELVRDIALDPYLDDVLLLALQISQTEKVQHPGQPGVGLRDAVFPLKALLAVKRNPWLPYVAVGGALLVPFLGGLLIGRAVGQKKARKL